jgi:hypothetical protein
MNRYVDPQTTYTTARAAQTLAGLAPALYMNRFWRFLDH